MKYFQKYEISAFSGTKNDVKIFVRSKVILVWSLVGVLLLTFGRAYHILLHSGRKYDIWPEIGLLGPGKHPETLYWPSHTIWRHFVKSRKNRIFDPQNHGKIFLEVDFFGRWSPATKSILGIDTSYWCPQDPIILLYWPRPFLSKSSIENSGKFENPPFFTKVLFLLLLLRFQCC